MYSSTSRHITLGTPSKQEGAKAPHRPLFAAGESFCEIRKRTTVRDTNNRSETRGRITGRQLEPRMGWTRLYAGKFRRDKRQVGMPAVTSSCEARSRKWHSHATLSNTERSSERNAVAAFRYLEGGNIRQILNLWEKCWVPFQDRLRRSGTSVPQHASPTCHPGFLAVRYLLSLPCQAKREPAVYLAN